MLLLNTHIVPFISRIGIVNATMPMENSTRTYLCSGCFKSLTKRHVIADSSYLQPIFQCMTGVSWLWCCNIFRLLFFFKFLSRHLSSI